MLDDFIREIRLIRRFKKSKIKTTFTAIDLYNFTRSSSNKSYTKPRSSKIYTIRFVENTIKTARKLGIIRQTENGLLEFVDGWSFADYAASSGGKDDRGGDGINNNGRGGGSSDGGDGGDGEGGIGEILAHPVLFSYDDHSFMDLVNNLFPGNKS